MSGDLRVICLELRDLKRSGGIDALFAFGERRTRGESDDGS